MFISHTIIHIGDKARLLLLGTRLQLLGTRLQLLGTRLGYSCWGQGCTGCIQSLDWTTGQLFFPLVLDCSIRVLQWRWWEVKSVAEAIMDVD